MKELEDSRTAVSSHSGDMTAPVPQASFSDPEPGAQVSRVEPVENLSAWSVGIFGGAAAISLPFVQAGLRHGLGFGYGEPHNVLLGMINSVLPFIPLFAMMICSPLPTLVRYWKQKEGGGPVSAEPFRLTEMPPAVWNIAHNIYTNYQQYRKSYRAPDAPRLRDLPFEHDPSALQIVRYGWVSWNGFLASFLGVLLASPILLLLRCFSDPHSLILFACLCLPLCFPLSAALLLKLWNPRRRACERLFKESTAVAASNRLTKVTGIVKRTTEDWTNNLIVYKYPFASGCLAFIAGIVEFVAMPYLPAGINFGTAVATFLSSCSNDASIPMPLESWFSWAITIGIGVFLLGVLSPLAVRLSAFYQLFLQKLALENAGGGMAEALSEALRMRRVKIKLAPSHPVLVNIAESLGWIAFCYAVLFSVVAFTPGALGEAIMGFLSTSILDAGLGRSMPVGWLQASGSGDLSDLVWHIQPQLRLFFASIVAAYGTAPFGMMACAFLPNRPAKHLFMSEQGVLVPPFAGASLLLNFIGLVPKPLLAWKDLKKARLIGTGKHRRDQAVEISFTNGVRFRIPLRLMSPEQTSELFTAIDEYADNCKMDENTAAFRTEIAAECPSPLVLSNSFTSTIFTTHRSGGLVLNGKYRIVRQIASKPLSAVYLARTLDNRLVVIKQFVMPRVDQTSESLKAAFWREHETLSRLNHPAIAKVVDMADETSGSYLVLEYIRGEDFRSFIGRCGARSSATVLEWAGELCRQMRYLHGQDPPLIHRDLSPDNIMLADDGSVRIIDFGAAHQFMEGVTGTLIGKQCYIAPEQLRGHANVRSDIYSFGGTLFFLLAGRDPAALRQCDPGELGLNIAPRLNEVIRRCTAFDESERPQSFEEVEHLLSEVNLIE